MKEFKEAGKKAKQLKSQEKVSQIYQRMAQIYHDLEPFEARVRQIYPHMTELFDILKRKEFHD